MVNLTFTVPGTDKPAVTRASAPSIPTSTERENTAFEYFDAAAESLGKFAVPGRAEGLSFLGVDLPQSLSSPACRSSTAPARSAPTTTPITTPP